MMLVVLRVPLVLAMLVVIGVLFGAGGSVISSTDSSACTTPSPMLKRSLVPPWAPLPPNKSSSLHDLSLHPLDSRTIFARSLVESANGNTTLQLQSRNICPHDSSRNCPDPLRCCGAQQQIACCDECCPGDFHCKPIGGDCCDGSTSVWCDSGQCCSAPAGYWCCDWSYKCCGTGCCGPSDQCCSGSCCQACCGSICCDENSQCCGGNCIPKSTACCNNSPCDGDCCKDSCIPKGATCCNSGKYCSADQDCCGGGLDGPESCIPHGDVCCGTRSCPSGSTCCGSGCAASGQSCCNGTACDSCCGGNCCNSGETCCNGKCMPSNWSCCNGNACDGDCCNGSCMPRGKTCCPNGKQCDSGTTCCGDSCAKSTESCCGGKVCASGGGCCVDASGLQTCGNLCTDPKPVETSQTAKSGGPSTAVIAAIVIAAVLALVLAAVLGCCISFKLFRHRDTPQDAADADQHPEANSGDAGDGVDGPNGALVPPPAPLHDKEESTPALPTTEIDQYSERLSRFDPYAILEYRRSATSASGSPTPTAGRNVMPPHGPSYNPFGIVRPSGPKGSVPGSSAPYGGLRVLSADGMSGYGTEEEMHGYSGRVEGEDASPQHFAASLGSVSPSRPAASTDGMSERIEPRLSMMDSDARSTHSTPSAAAAAAMALPLEVLQPHQREIVRSLQANRVSATGILDIYSHMVAENEQQRDQHGPNANGTMAGYDGTPPYE
ncbi:hypothetical protein BKA62DRAFT_353198 [Auriculariales sp. MPI-PUGE-AT-0066]|nr:hypothetical protein BKA62DRAFT_353198 [Auriculariales sp. MPI-PUGE-AT-0066]